MVLSGIETEIRSYIDRFQMDRFLNDKLMKNLELFHLNAYETIMRERTEIPYIYFLVDGQVKCAHYNSNGTLAVVAMMHPFAVLGDVEIIGNDLTMTSVVTTCPSKVLGIPAPAARKEGLNDPAFP